MVYEKDVNNNRKNDTRREKEIDAKTQTHARSCISCSEFLQSELLWRVMERTHRVIALPPPLCDVAIAIIDSSVPAPRPDPSRLGQPSRRPAITRS